jgi:hypothetical protein
MRTLGNKRLRQDLKVGTHLLYRECRTVCRMDLLLPRIFQLGCQKVEPVVAENVYFLPLSSK